MTSIAILKLCILINQTGGTRCNILVKALEKQRTIVKTKGGKIPRTNTLGGKYLKFM